MTFGKILITGGAGFIGSQLVKKMLPISDHIYIIDDLSTGNIDSIPKHAKITFYHSSITNEAVLDKILPKVDYIFHLACKNLVLSYHNINDDFETNLYGGLRLLQKSQQLAPQLKRFIYTSTASVYGNAEVLPTTEDYYNIKLPYSASKFSTEHYCHVYYNIYGLPITILRLSNVYGPGQLISNPYCGVVAKFFEAARNKENMMIFGDGKQTRDFTYIEDSLDAILLVATKNEAIGQVFNVGTNKETSIINLAEQISKVSGNNEAKLQFVQKREVDVVERRCLNNERLNTIGWNCKYDLYSGLMKTYSWLEEGDDS